MRPLAAIAPLLLAALLAQPVAAQPPTFDEAYQVRGALGDIPTTSAAEPAGAWNLEQRLAWPAADGDTVAFTLPAGATLANTSCTCPRMSQSASGNTVTLTLEDAAEGETTVTVTSRQPVSEAFGFTLRAPTQAPADRVVILYVPGGSELESQASFGSPGASTDGSAVIRFAQFSAAQPMPGDLWVAIHPATTAAEPETPVDGDEGVAWYLPLAAGLLLGAVLWAFLVARGLVQAKSRRQVAATAAHVEAAATEPPAVLEGKKRALLAALKEVELARQSEQMSVEVYDAVKADLKKQAVTVMRALEASGAKS